MTHREKFIQGLRDLAGWLEENETMPVGRGERVMVFVDTVEQLSGIARLMSAEKEHLGDWFALNKSFGPVEYALLIPRERVCKRTVVGTREEPAKTVEIVEWSCSESILAD